MRSQGPNTKHDTTDTPRKPIRTRRNGNPRTPRLPKTKRDPPSEARPKPTNDNKMEGDLRGDRFATGKKRGKDVRYANRKK